MNKIKNIRREQPDAIRVIRLVEGATTPGKNPDGSLKFGDGGMIFRFGDGGGGDIFRFGDGGGDIFRFGDGGGEIRFG
jgi:hypothetical protein